MSLTSEPPSSDPPQSPARRKFLLRISSLPIKPAARDYYVRWAESWTKALGHQSADRTQAYFNALGRSASIADWQFRQAVDAARILACDVLAIPWASSFDWQSLVDQARSLEPDHRTLARETIQVRAKLPILQPQSPEQAAHDEVELTKLIDALRRAVRLKGRAVATEETYVYWNRRFIRFCFQKLGQAPYAAGPSAISAYLDFLALERNVAPATQHQALNAMVFLVKNVFGIEDFTLDHFTPARGQRRPPVVMTREKSAPSSPVWKIRGNLPANSCMDPACGSWKASDYASKTSISAKAPSPFTTAKTIGSPGVVSSRVPHHPAYGSVQGGSNQLGAFAP